MIICAALLVQVEGLEHTTVVTCRRHGDGYRLLKDLGYAPQAQYEIVEDGFINHKGEFLNRKDAWLHAVECGQLPYNLTRFTSHDILFSEDLY